MTQATATAVFFKHNRGIEFYTTSKHKTNTRTSTDVIIRAKRVSNCYMQEKKN